MLFTPTSLPYEGVQDAQLCTYTCCIYRAGGRYQHCPHLPQFGARGGKGWEVLLRALLPSGDNSQLIVPAQLPLLRIK